MRSDDWKNIRSASAAVFAVALAQVSTTPVQAADYDVGSIHITAPWARATPKGASSGAAYVTIANKGTVPDRVTCVSSDVSAACQIHTVAMERGVMKMRPVEGGLEIKPGETVTLKPSALHLMLMDLKHPLEQGKMVEATLQFEKAGTVKIEFPMPLLVLERPELPQARAA
jgi:periplasmic copper chaperone A